MKRFGKTIWAVLIAFIMAVSLPAAVFAGNNGPSEEQWGTDYFAFIKIIENRENGTVYEIFKNNAADNSALPGATYDRETNTLTLDQFQRPDCLLSTNMMGDDFTLKVEGECELSHIYVWGDMYGGSMTITGNGSITVNRNKEEESGIYFMAEATDSRLAIDENVTAAIYGSGYAVSMIESTAPGNPGLITVGGASAGEIITEERPYYTENRTIQGIYLISASEDRGYQVASASDPDGIYAAEEIGRFTPDPGGPYDEDLEQTGYWTQYIRISRFVYSGAFDAYVEDPGFEPEEMTEEAFEASPIYSYAADGTEYKYINFYGEGLEENQSYGAYEIINPDDTTGNYIFYIAGDVYDGESGSDIFDWGRLCWNESAQRYEEDDSFEKDPDYITREIFEERGFEYVLQPKKIEFTAAETGTEEYDVGTDDAGNLYAVYYPDVYDFSEDEAIGADGQTWYPVTPNDSVDVYELTPVADETSEPEMLYNHYLNTTELIADGSGVSNLRTQPIGEVRIEGATLSFQAGDQVVFTGSVPEEDEEMYMAGNFNWGRGLGETWDADDGTYTFNCSMLGDPGESGEGFFKTFSAGRVYTYSIGAYVLDDYWYNGWYFDENVKLILNGEERDCTVSVSDGTDGREAGRTVSFTNVATFSTIAGPVSLADSVVTIPALDYSGKNLVSKVSPTVKVGSTTLTKGTDYDVYYMDPDGNRVTTLKNPGMYLAVFTGKGNYTDGTSAEFLIRFADVKKPADFWYDPVYWAVERGITTGWLEDGTFRPWNTCNRAAVITFLWRMAGKPEPSSIAGFKDMPKDEPANRDFRKAISWGAENGIVAGYSGNLFKPWNTCNRAAIITFIWRFAGRPEPSSIAGFKDMPKDVPANQDFRKAISWAVENKITGGYDDGTFRPWNNCNRASTVTFLHRYAS